MGGQASTGQADDGGPHRAVGEGQKIPGGLRSVYLAKGSRVYVSGLLSVLIPAYLRVLGYSGFYVGVVLAAILAGNAVSNFALTYLDKALGRRRLLLLFSILMVVSGILFSAVDSFAGILIASLVGNISTTGTEAGPFQSVEAGILPDLAGEGRTGRAFGVYNMIGYGASAVGAFTLSVPGSTGDSLPVFQGLFLVFAAVGGLLFFLYSRLSGVDVQEVASAPPAALSQQGKKDVRTLSALFSIDAFGGSFVSQYLLSYWLNVAFGASNDALALIFLTTNVIAAASTYVAASLGGRFGNLRTMVVTHLASNVFLLLVAFAGTLGLAVAFLFARQSLSQMDVPTRQALMAEMFARGDRVPANAVTNIARSLGAVAGGPVSAVILGGGAVVAIVYLGSFSKILYDSLVFVAYRKRFR